MKFYLLSIISLLFVISIWLYRKTPHTERTSQQALHYDYTPANTIIAFDIHEVIVKKYIWPMLKTACHYPHKWQIIRSSSWSSWRKIFGCIWHKKWNNMRRIAYDENPYLYEFIHQVADTQYPIEETATIIKQLKTMGYELHILSNISEEAYISFKKKFPEIFTLFDAEQLSIWDKGIVIEKPNPEYFKRYITNHNPANKHVVFIDDKQENIDAAESLGIIGIAFKSPKKLKQTLINMKILTKETQKEIAT